MKNYFYFFTAVLFCFLGGCFSGKQDGIDTRLSELDSLLYTRPGFVLDSIDKFKADFSEEQKAHARLIKSIALCRNNHKFKQDTLIAFPYKFYKKEYEKRDGDKPAAFNYARACLYAAIIKYGIKSKDTLVYPLLKDAQQLFEEIHTHSYCLAQTYIYLGNLNNDYRENDASDYYYNRAFEQFASMRDSVGATSLKINIASSKIVSRTYAVVDSLLYSIREQDLVNDDLKYAYYSLCAAYYAVIRKYDKAVEYAKLKNNVHLPKLRYLDMAKINYNISRYYSFLNETDSALVYANKAIQSAIDSDVTSERIHFYFRNLGDIYYKAGEYRLASVAFRKAFVHSLNSTSLFHKNRIAEIEKNYNQSLKISDSKRNVAEVKVIVFSFIAVILISLLIIGQLLYKNRINREVKKNLELHQEALENDLMQSKAMIEVVSVSLGVLPDFIDKVNDLSSKLFSLDPELFDIFQREIGVAKSGTRKRLLDLVNNQSLMNACPVLNYLDTFSNQEKMIILLLEQNYNTRSITRVLNITQSSVRASKVRIRNKILCSKVPPDIQEKILALL